jgi:hypothetical protein
MPETLTFSVSIGNLGALVGLDRGKTAREVVSTAAQVLTWDHVGGGRYEASHAGKRYYVILEADEVTRMVDGDTVTIYPLKDAPEGAHIELAHPPLAIEIA